ncbi:8-oxo-dGTP pyrophosphatase MutT (NUDIX family) [Rhizobium sp. PP-F2F-G38]|nr:8-oxo-dGTP pyrophosphatase MutT (NUDIX family) [Rhizobium sp. PP-WC-1G-195]PYE99732.1 8-oxo-dGTP pyrophosphatase MutT (NUDIX family) [Rhizobium sp. PP-F2F-G38]TCQ12086.1 8-oxo-dGTP pyrophosphatase MutT (NUDIX family) [Rhizobium sp. PP-F2F-G36]
MTILDSIVSEVRLMFRRPERMQFAALCYRFRKKSAVPEMLLITSRDTGRWVIPKGWPMEGKASHEVAAREAWEEAGVKGEPSSDSIGSFIYEKGMNNGLKITCRVHVYPVVVFDMAKRFPEKGSRTLEWVTFTEAAGRVAEPSLRALILDFQTQLLATMQPDEPRSAAQ